MVMILVTLEALTQFTIEQDGQVITWQPGQRQTLTLKKARQIAQSAGREKVRVLHGHTQDIEGAIDSQAIQPGDWIAWHRSKNLPMYSGEVELIHMDDAGITWAFVALPDEEFALVNLQCAQQIDEDA